MTLEKKMLDKSSYLKLELSLLGQFSLVLHMWNTRVQ